MERTASSYLILLIWAIQFLSSCLETRELKILNNCHPQLLDTISFGIGEEVEKMYRFHPLGGPLVQFSNDFRTAERLKAKTDVRQQQQHSTHFFRIINYRFITLINFQDLIWYIIFHSSMGGLCLAKISWKRTRFFKLELKRRYSIPN